MFEKIRQWRSVRKGLAKRSKGKLVDIVEPLLDRLIEGRINPGQIMYKYFGKVFANLGRKSLQHARWGTDIMKFVAGAQCHRGGKTVLRYLRGPAGAGERRDAPLEDIIENINLLFPDESSVPKFIKDDSVDPNFNFGLSEKTLLHVFKQYCGGDAAVPTVTSTVTSAGHSAPINK